MSNTNMKNEGWLKSFDPDMLLNKMEYQLHVVDLNTAKFLKQGYRYHKTSVDATTTGIKI